MTYKILPWILLFTAIGLSITAAYYSIIGLSMLFVGAQIPVIIMTFFLETAKVSTAAALHTYWMKMNRLLRTYLTTAVIVISIITSMGIYGLLSSGYQSTNIQYSQMVREIEFQNSILQDYETQRDLIVEEIGRIDGDISNLRGALGSNVIQYVAESGEIVTTTSSANRRIFEEQLNLAFEDRQTQTQNLNVLRDSIRVVNNRILEAESDTDISTELGPLIYLSNIVDRPMDNIVNYLMLILVFVFDPLALSLIITALFAFKQIRKNKEKNVIIEKVDPPKKTEPVEEKKKIEPVEEKKKPKEILKDIKYKEISPDIKSKDKIKPSKFNRFVSLFNRSFKQPKKNPPFQGKIYN